jgi:hypothetical protein
MTREEHLDRSKQRALVYLDKGELPNAVASLISDLGTHEETRVSMNALKPGLQAAVEKDPDAVRKWIEGIK